MLSFAKKDIVAVTHGGEMHQSLKEELVQTLDRLSLEQLLAVLRFAQHIAQQATEQAIASVEVNDKEAERATADFFAAAGCGHSGDPKSSLHVDAVLYGRQETR
jgi:hypothetical protein